MGFPLPTVALASAAAETLPKAPSSTTRLTAYAPLTSGVNVATAAFGAAMEAALPAGTDARLHRKESGWPSGDVEAEPSRTSGVPVFGDARTAIFATGRPSPTVSAAAAAAETLPKRPSSTTSRTA